MKPTHLVLLVHCDPSMRARYVEACAAAGITADVVALVGDPVPGLPGGGLSARYDEMGRACKRLTKGRSAVEGLVLKFKPPHALSDYEHVMLATYSAGYGFARQLTDLDRAMLSGLVEIDSGHSAEGSPGTSLDWLVVWAQAARAGRKVLAIGHSDVDPVTYASTTETAQAAIDRSGGELAELGLEPGAELGLKRRRREGGFVVEAYDRQPAAHAKEEHGQALTVWGPALVARACAMVTGIPLGSDAPQADPDPPPDTRRKGPVVSPAAASGLGDNLSPTVADPGESFGTFKIPDPDPQPAKSDHAPAFPHGYRCSVAELVADAVKLGTWHPKTTGGNGLDDAGPRVGDLIISARNGQEPEHGGSGHVERVTQEVASDVVLTAGGNEQNTWIVAEFELRSEAYRGWIACGPLGEKAAQVAIEEARQKVHELPGPQHSARIQEYHARARRRGSPVAGMPGHEAEGVDVLGAHAPDEVAWCASGASWCAYQAAKARL